MLNNFPDVQNLLLANAFYNATAGQGLWLGARAERVLHSLMTRGEIIQRTCHALYTVKSLELIT